MVPFGLGGSADVAARLLAEPLSQALGQPVVVENRPGGGAVIGTDAVAKAAARWPHPAADVEYPHGQRDAAAAAGPMRCCATWRRSPRINIAFHVLAVHPSLGVRTVPELIAKARAAPGTLDYASSGPGTPYHIAGEVFAALAGIELNHIPFRGINEARTALIAGQVPIMFDAIPTMREQISGRAGDRARHQRAAAQPAAAGVCRRWPRACRASRPRSGSG